MLDWAFGEFNNYALFKAGEKVDEASVWLGKTPSIPLLVKDDIKLTFKRKYRRKMKVKLIYQSPISSPIKKGTEVGKIIITIPGQSNLEVPVLAGADVDQLGLFGDELVRKVAQKKRGPSKWNRWAPPTFPNGGPSGAAM